MTSLGSAAAGGTLTHPRDRPAPGGLRGSGRERAIARGGGRRNGGGGGGGAARR